MKRQSTTAKLTTASLVDALMHDAGSLDWGSLKGRILDWWLADLIPSEDYPHWAEQTTITFTDGSTWEVWYW